MASGARLDGLSHIDLSVRDRHASARWYADVLDFEIRGDRFNEAARLPWVHVVHPCGLSMGLVEHPDNPGEPFDERRSGLDHVSFVASTRDDLDSLARRVTDRGYGDPIVKDRTRVALLVLRDPDHTQVEVCYWKVPDSE